MTAVARADEPRPPVEGEPPRPDELAARLRLRPVTEHPDVHAIAGVHR
ncbi:hypothetical protein [Actinomadura napierensis]